MALKGQFDFKGITIPEAYVKVKRPLADYADVVEGGPTFNFMQLQEESTTPATVTRKYKIYFNLEIYSDSTKKNLLDSITMVCDHNLSGDIIYKQAYTYVKSIYPKLVDEQPNLSE